VLRELMPVFKERVWGGSYIAGLFPKAPASGPVGEAWLVSGHPSGCTLDTDGRSPDDLAPNHPWFPVLIKLLHADQDLSVQVHPNDEQAAALGDRGKSEGWLILRAEPGSRICYGLVSDGADDLRAAIGRGEIESRLRYVQAREGAYYPVPPGTVHALGAGLTVLEVQQASDTTFRLYDYGRPGTDGRPRDLHVEQAIAVISFPQPPLPDAAPSGTDPLDDNPYFRFSVKTVDGRSAVPARAGCAVCLVNLDAGVVPEGFLPDGRAYRSWVGPRESAPVLVGNGRVAVVHVPV
jgi:mannose-6-phosphate isomerase